MSAILNPTSIVYCDDSLSVNNRTPIVAEIWCGDASDLPDPEDFAGYILITGSKSICANGDEYGLNGSSWVLHDQSPFSNVYTKTEVDNITNAIAADVGDLQIDVGNLQMSNNNQDAYIYALIGQSALNLLDSSVWEGQTPGGSGYICQDLAITLPAGSYIWKMKRDGNTSSSFVLKAADNTELYRVNRGAGVNDITQPFTLSADAVKISIYVGYNITYSDNMIYKDLTA